MKNKFKWSLLAIIAMIATVAMAADKYISSSGNIVLKTATSKSVNLQDTLYTTQAGKVGIGLSNPSYPLHVVGTGGLGLAYSSSATGGVRLYPMSDTTGGLRFHTDSSCAGGAACFAFMTYNGGYADRVVIDSSGNVGIGTSSPNNKLDLYDGIFEIEHTGSTDRFFDFKQSSGWNMRLIGRSTSTYIGIDSVEGTGGTTGRPLKLNPSGGDVTLGGTYRFIKAGGSQPTHINDLISTTAIPGGSSENIFSIAFSNTASHSGSARVLITSNGERGGAGFGGRVLEYHIGWVTGSAMGVTTVHDMTYSNSPSISYSVATNVITFYATAGSATSHYSHSIEIQGQTGVYGQDGITYTRYGD